MKSLDTKLVTDFAHRNAWRYKKSTDPRRSDIYTFNSSTLMDFTAQLLAAVLVPAPTNEQAAFDDWHLSEYGWPKSQMDKVEALARLTGWKARAGLTAPAGQPKVPTVTFPRSELDAAERGELPNWESPLMTVHQHGAQYAVRQLADLLGVTDYDPGDGSESYDGDLRAGLRSVLSNAAGVPNDDFKVVSLEALKAVDASVVARGFHAMDSAPKDGRQVQLLMAEPTESEYAERKVHPTEDGGPWVTIGHNTLGDTQVDEWILAGWDWSHDEYTASRGSPIGWAPLVSMPTSIVSREL